MFCQNGLDISLLYVITYKILILVDIICFYV